MMVEEMDKISAPSSRERAQRLYEKNMELENRRRRSAQARIPSDPNAWQQMRENYEAIILEDHAFSEQHNIEYALWQLHYKRIEELRAHFSAALTSAGSNTSQGGKGPARPDRVAKIKLQFKTFLSEATGFYHDLILKTRAKYGLPLGNFTEDSENRMVTEKDVKKSAEMKKGLISCHRCLIYLGDLARYKGLYGEGDSKSREFAAASSYYLQAASLWPSSGNPHHQLAILASYSGDELVAVYRYFRSLAVDSPFSTARDNLIVAFEKNRQSYSQLSEDIKASAVKELPVRLTGNGRGRGEAKLASKDNNLEGSQVKDGTSNVLDTYKSFCIRFVRLNGILFTRTSLETVAEVLAVVSSGLRELLSTGTEEVLNFGADALENGLLIVRLIAILVFTVHNVRRETDGQSYSEIVQRAVLLRNAFTAVFELMGHILERCVQLRDPSSSYLLPGILVFVEWLACCPDIVAGSDVDEKQETVRSRFWKNCISFWNKLLFNELVSLDDDEDESCFNNLSRYEEEETENRRALWEDFELRGFVPLLPAQTILDFSGKQSFGGDGTKEKMARVKRILAAGKALANVVRVDQETVRYDSKVKKFVIGVEPQISDDRMLTNTYAAIHTNGIMYEKQMEKTTNFGVLPPNPGSYMDGEEEDEVIVFKPTVAERQSEVIGLEWTPYEGLEPGQHASADDLRFVSSSVSAPIGNLQQQNVLGAGSQVPASVSNIVPHYLQPIPSYASKSLAGKNRQSYSQLSEDIKASAVKELPVRLTGNGRGRGEAKLASKDNNLEGSQVKDGTSNVLDTYKSFCIRFVRLNGILFTRTSLETVAEVLAVVSSGLRELLSTGTEEVLNFGADALENGLLIVRLIAILVFTVHNVRRETDGQSYSEIVQRAVLLRNAFTAVFELMGHILERCVQLRDPSSSYLLPGILVFVEWLACCPDIVAGSDVDEKQETVRSRFWKNCISFWNKLLFNELVSLDDDEDESCFNNLSRYEEEETENRRALWEDFELRGFVPLLPAQTILDFSGKQSFGGDGTKEKMARVKRILAAGKALANVVRVDQETVRYDSKVKKFVIGVEPQISDDRMLTNTYAAIHTNGIMYEKQMEKTTNFGVLPPNPGSYMDGEEEDEVIVFKPTVAERQSEVIGLEWTPYEGLEPGQHASADDLRFVSSSVSAPIGNLQQQNVLGAGSQVPASVSNIVPHYLQPIPSYASKSLVEEEALLAKDLKGLRFLENGHVVKSELQDISIPNPTALSASIQQAVSANANGLSYGFSRGPEAVMLPKMDAFASSGLMSDHMAVKVSSALPAGLRKNPVSRPVRHIGPPPGFTSVRSKQVNEPFSGSELVTENPLMDDYSWLDGYQLPSVTKDSGPNSSINFPPYSNSLPINVSNGLSGTVSFPFPGKQVPTMPFPAEKQKGWQEYQVLEQLNLHPEQQLQQQHQHPLINGNQRFPPPPEQYQGHSIWTGVASAFLLALTSRQEFLFE
ncbi:Protein SMG7 [Morella rubra]|uniref:Protein SMG7 n=1 Tax=Morella rubra TaxID=262757 RepID=A0A6A1WQY0_9ROSI|nr:Protein SMG7 [Morella rubra]